MEKVDLYGLIHKAQRKYLFELSIKIGQTDFEDPAQALEIKKSIAFIIDHLYKHSEHEEALIHPLYSNFTNEPQIQEIITEHKSFEVMLEKISKLIEDNNYADLYSNFNRFIAEYLTHIDKEEEAQKQILWKHYTNEELMEVMKKFQVAFSPEETLEHFRFMFPAFSVSEIISIINPIKASAPPSFYQEAYQIAKNCSSEDKWQEIEKAIL